MPNQTPSPIRIAVVQCAILWNDISGNCQQIERYVQQLQGQADLIIFPETITTGFSAEAAQRADSQKGEVYTFLQKIASEYQVAFSPRDISLHQEVSVHSSLQLWSGQSLLSTAGVSYPLSATICASLYGAGIGRMNMTS